MKSLRRFLQSHDDLEIRFLGSPGWPSGVLVTVECRRTGAAHGRLVSTQEFESVRSLVKALREIEAHVEKNETSGEPASGIEDICIACGHTQMPTCDCACHSLEETKNASS